MRIVNPFSGRPADYDRNPSTATGANTSQVAIAPHAFVTRWTYTVPAGRKSRVGNALGHMFRNSAAGTLGNAHIEIQWSNLFLIYNDFFNNTQGAVGDQINSGTFYMLAGQQIADCGYAAGVDSATHR